jgi:hypothetical protein
MEAKKMYERDIGYTAPEVRRERKWERKVRGWRRQ